SAGTAVTLTRVSSTGKVDAPQTLPVQPSSLEGPWLGCVPDRCVVVVGTTSIEIARGAIGKPVALDDWRQYWEVLVPALRDRPLVAARSVWLLRELRHVALASG